LGKDAEAAYRRGRGLGWPLRQTGPIESSNPVNLRATMLLDAGASLTIRDSLLQSTPLGWACRWGRIELVRLYLERGADAVESDAEPWATPLAWAAQRGHHEIVQLLRSAGAGA
jgi:ankyrin repeat protein